MKINLKTTEILHAMKNMFIIVAGLLLLAFVAADSQARKTGDGNPAEQQIAITCSPDLSALAHRWAEEYGRLHPDMEITIFESETGLTGDAISAGVRLGVVSDNYLRASAGQDIMKMTVGRDVILPVMNAENPFRDAIAIKGITLETLAGLNDASIAPSWDNMIDGAGNIPVTIYVSESAAEGLAGSLKSDALATGIFLITGDEQLVQVLRNNPNALGFGRITEVADMAANAFTEGIVPVPIDRNGSGEVEYFEDIYASPEAFTRGVWVGKYPKELVCGIYSLAAGLDNHPQDKDFLKWVVTDGQKYLSAYGFSELASGEIRSRLGSLTDQNAVLEASTSSYAGFRIVIMILVVSILAGIIIEAIVLFRRGRNAVVKADPAEFSGAFNEESIRLPKGLFYDKTHTWAFMQTDGKVKIGMDDFLPRITGHLTGITMKEPGDRIKKGEVVLSIIQKGKKLNIKSPVSGIILEKNSRLLHSPSAINFSPYSDGWVYMIEPTNWLREIQLLFLADKFRGWLKGEFLRLKDFMALVQAAPATRYAHVVYQEGGELKENILMDMGPEVWEEFQSNYIETTT